MSHISVLVADDDAATRDAVARTLQRRFNVAKSVADGKQLLDAACEQDVDVIVSDLCMPELTGMDVMRALASRGRTIPFVVMSATVGVARDCVALGANAFVSKMDIDSELVPAVLAALDGRTYLSAACAG